MSTTANEVFILGMAIADEMSDTANVVNASDTASYKARTPAILTLLQAELVRQGDLYKNFEVSCKPMDNLLGKSAGFDVITYLGIEGTKTATGSVRAYTFEVDGEGTVTIEDYDGTWHTLASVTTVDSATRKFTTYKGIVTPTAGATQSRFRFTGLYEYNVTNYAMFSMPMKATRIPTYRPWYKVELPTDFKSMEQVISEYPDRNYVENMFYKWENFRDLFVNYFYEGMIRINYRPIPAIVATINSILELDDSICRTLLPYGLVAELMKEENPIISKYCRDRYIELKSASLLRRPAEEGTIFDVYGGFGTGSVETSVPSGTLETNGGTVAPVVDDSYDGGTPDSTYTDSVDGGGA